MLLFSRIATQIGLLHTRSNRGTHARLQGGGETSRGGGVLIRVQGRGEEGRGEREEHEKMPRCFGQYFLSKV